MWVKWSGEEIDLMFLMNFFWLLHFFILFICLTIHRLLMSVSIWPPMMVYMWWINDMGPLNSHSRCGTVGKRNIASSSRWQVSRVVEQAGVLTRRQVIWGRFYAHVWLTLVRVRVAPQWSTFMKQKQVYWRLNEADGNSVYTYFCLCVSVCLMHLAPAVLASIN